VTASILLHFIKKDCQFTFPVTAAAAVIRVSLRNIPNRTEVILNDTNCSLD
jgi:hypothetical protein